MQKIIKVSDFDSLRASLCKFEPLPKIVHCHGVFDVLHFGHLNYFKEAKKHGQRLIVTVTSDRYVNKGPGRPHFSEKIRAQMLSELSIVDYVAISDFPTALEVIEKLKPDFYVKGPDYRDHTKDVTGEIKNEVQAVESYGGKVVYTSGETFSSSQLINKFMSTWSDDQLDMINTAKELGGIERIEAILKGLAKLKVTVTGEPILDVYRFCEPQNISSKSPSISAKFLYEETYAGGVLAIANHLADFVDEVKLVTTVGSGNILKGLLDSRIKTEIIIVPHRTPRKTRYIAIDKSQRIFEITDCPDNQWENRKPGDFIYAMKDSALKADQLIIADFGHGLFEGQVLECLQWVKTPIALNVQTNSSNYGFNRISKHFNYSYLSLDLREARLDYNKRDMNPKEIVEDLLKDKGRAYSLTLGKNGSYFKNNFSPAFADQVVDATGAGDAYFAITSLLTRVDCPEELIPFIGNVYAGLKTKVIGNKQAITKAQLLKALTGILK